MDSDLSQASPTQVSPTHVSPTQGNPIQDSPAQQAPASEELALEITLPTYDDRCITALVPALLAGVKSETLSEAVVSSRTVVLLLVDGLGWHQLRRNRHLAPVLAAASDATRPISTVAPSTTVTALTSLTTGATPGEHGLVGYRVATHLGSLNALRWRAAGRDMRTELPPQDLQPIEPFCGRSTAAVTDPKFRDSGFTAAHLRGAAFRGGKDVPGIVDAVREAIDAGFQFVFAYYADLDKVAHEFGFGARYSAVLAEAERLTVTLRSSLPAAIPLIVTADHGMVEVVDPPIMIDYDISALASNWSGEARLLWLHARAGAESELLDACERRYASLAEVAPVERVLQEGWLGRHVTATARSRLGDVALVPRGLQAFTMPDEQKRQHALRGRHGGLTAEEMLVPLAQL